MRRHYNTLFRNIINEILESHNLQNLDGFTILHFPGGPISSTLPYYLTTFCFAMLRKFLKHMCCGNYNNDRWAARLLAIKPQRWNCSIKFYFIAFILQKLHCNAETDAIRIYKPFLHEIQVTLIFLEVGRFFRKKMRWVIHTLDN